MSGDDSGNGQQKIPYSERQDLRSKAEYLKKRIEIESPITVLGGGDRAAGKVFLRYWAEKLETYRLETSYNRPARSITSYRLARKFNPHICFTLPQIQRKRRKPDGRGKLSSASLTKALERLREIEVAISKYNEFCASFKYDSQIDKEYNEISSLPDIISPTQSQLEKIEYIEAHKFYFTDRRYNPTTGLLLCMYDLVKELTGRSGKIHSQGGTLGPSKFGIGYEFSNAVRVKFEIYADLLNKN